MIQVLLILALATAVATFLGGIFAMRYKDKTHLIVGFSAGAVIGVAFFDLLPESIELAGHNATSIVALGFIAYLIIDRMWGLHKHAHNEDGEEEHNHEHSHDQIENQKRGVLRASSFSFHSFLDGVAIGLSFQVSATLGSVVAIAVLAHDFSDGINTVASIIKSGGSLKKAFRWLLVDALAPVAGIFSTLLFSVPEKILGVILSVFCGFFLYIGASDLIPESYHAHPTKWTTFMTILGAGFIWFVISVAH